MLASGLGAALIHRSRGKDFPFAATNVGRYLFCGGIRNASSGKLRPRPPHRPAGTSALRAASDFPAFPQSPAAFALSGLFPAGRPFPIHQSVTPCSQSGTPREGSRSAAPLGSRRPECCSKVGACPRSPATDGRLCGGRIRPGQALPAKRRIGPPCKSSARHVSSLLAGKVPHRPLTGLSAVGPCGRVRLP